MQPDNPSTPKGVRGAQVAKVSKLATYQDGAVVSREVVKKPTGNVTLFAFDVGQGLSEHTAPFNALAPDPLQQMDAPVVPPTQCEWRSFFSERPMLVNTLERRRTTRWQFHMRNRQISLTSAH